MATWKRRQILNLLAGMAAPLLGTAASTQALEYRIDVQILALGLPVFSRRGVGEGVGRLRCENLAGEARTSFEFGAASIPARAHGLRQMGYFEEELVESGGKLISSQYFGFLTATPPTAPNRVSLEKAVHDRHSVQYCCAVEGSIVDGRGRFSKSYEAPLPQGAGMSMLATLKSAMRRVLAEVCHRACLGGETEAQRTFLGALLLAALGPQDRLAIAYQYGDRHLKFESQRRKDAEDLVIEAMVQGQGRHSFRFAVPATGRPALPHRIEYQPKAWLKLTLVAQAEGTEEKA